MPDGVCVIQAFEDFNANKSEDLILFELGIVVRFPPGSTAIISSAIITHDNTTISEHETRRSIIQYFAGAVKRWVAYGRQTWKSLQLTDSSKAKEITTGNSTQRVEGKEKFSFLKALASDHADVCLCSSVA